MIGAPEPRRARRILVVNDEPAVREALVDTLEPLGYEVRVAASGEEALAAVGDPRLDLVLLDMKMPGLDGPDVLEHVERERPGLRVVMISSEGSVDAAVTSMKHGALDVLQKPFSADAVRRLVRREMDVEERSRVTALGYEAHLERARSLIRERRFETAGEHVREALAADESRPEAFNLAGVLAWLRTDRPEARKQWRLALAHDSAYGPAKRNLARATRRPHEDGPPDLGDRAGQAS